MMERKIKKSSFLRGAWARYRKNRPALIGLVIIAVVIFLAIFADVGVMILAVLNAIRCLFVKKL